MTIQKKTKAIIEYNPQLTNLLEVQHIEIMQNYRAILRLAKAKQFKEINRSLKSFAKLVSTHFGDERELYMYLELVVSKADGRYRDTRREMKDIAVTVSSILNLHINNPVSEESYDDFVQDFSMAGKDLMGRIRYEEQYLFKEYSGIQI